jgi:hypothetical protein
MNILNWFKKQEATNNETTEEIEATKTIEEPEETELLSIEFTVKPNLDMVIQSFWNEETPETAAQLGNLIYQMSTGQYIENIVQSLIDVKTDEDSKTNDFVDYALTVIKELYDEDISNGGQFPNEQDDESSIVNPFLVWSNKP